MPSRDPETHATVQLLGLAASALLTHFESLAGDARLGPTVRDTLEVARHASARFAVVDRALAVLTDSGSGAEQSLIGIPAMVEFHHHTAPTTWPELLLKTVLVCGFAHDFEQRLGDQVPAVSRTHVGSLVDEGQTLAWWARQSLEAQTAADPEAAHQLGLFGRRVVAEASAQAQRLANQYPELMALVTGTQVESIEELSATVQLIADLVESSAQRMMTLGLQP